MIVASLALLVGFQGPVLPDKAKWPWLMGQREVALGPQPLRRTIMVAIVSKEIEPMFTSKAILPGGWSEFRFGRAQSEVIDDNLFNKPCRKIQLSGLSTYSINYYSARRGQETANVTWWVTPKGKILRQYAERETPMGMEVADATYGVTEIEVRRTDPAGKTTFATFHVENEMEAIQRQFVPMLEGDKLLTPRKEFKVLDPFTGGLVAMKAEIQGRFTFREGGKKYEGRMCNVTAGSGRANVLITAKGDIVRVELGKDRYLVRTDAIDPVIGGQ